MSDILYTHPVFDCVTVELNPINEKDPRKTSDHLLRNVVAEIPGVSIDNWVISSTGDPNDYDLIAPEHNPGSSISVSISKAWEIYYALLSDERVTNADLNFDMILENGENGGNERVEVFEEVEGDLSESHRDWSPKLIKAFCAWKLPLPNSDSLAQGEGIRIGHPDSGYLPHSELYDPDVEAENRISSELGFDYVDEVNPPLDGNPENPDDPNDPSSGHGLGTASVIMSADNSVQYPNSITGVAPKAELVPLRVAKKRKIIPDGLLLWSGMRRLRDAINYAVEELEGGEQRCHIISISLGWLWCRGVHKAVKRARKKNIIVCAAAGNDVKFVVWPARYKEVIAVAGCDFQSKQWPKSCRGKSVDVTAPAKNVWKAAIGRNSDESGMINQDSGTSYSVASTAGIAALWLAYHGRDNLLKKYAGKPSYESAPLTEVFRKVLKESCDELQLSEDGDGDGKYGAGIVNAKKTLLHELPSIESMQDGLMDQNSTLLGVENPKDILIKDLPDEGIEGRLAFILGDDSGRMSEKMDLVMKNRGIEILFHIYTNPSLRQYMFPEVSNSKVNENEKAAGQKQTLLELDTISPQLREDLS